MSSTTRLTRVILFASLMLNLVFVAGWLRNWRLSHTPPALEAVAFEPGAKGEAGRFVVRFTRPISAAGVAGTQSAQPLRFSPELAYQVVWESAQRAVVLPAKPTVPGKRYRVQPSPGLTGTNGERVNPRAIAVVAGQLRVEAVGTPERLDECRTRLSFRFNGPVSPRQLAESSRVVTNTGRNLTITAPDTRPTFRPSIEVELPETVAEVVVSLSPALRAEGGDEGLAEEYEARITLGSGFSVSEVSAETDQERIGLSCALPGEVLPDEARGRISVQPPVEFRVEPEYWGNRFRLVGEFQPQALYRVTFHKGLRTKSGLSLAEDTVRTVVTGDREPCLRFLTEGPYLPRHRQPRLPLRVCNVETLRVTVDRIYPNNLVSFFRDGESTSDWNGQRVGSKRQRTALAPNAVGTEDLLLDDLLGGASPGIYLVQTVADGQYWPRAERTVVWTGLGVSAALTPDQVLVWVTRMDNNQPVSGAEVELLSARNQGLGGARTDGEGLARLSVSAQADAAERPYLAVVRTADDLALACLTPEYQHDLSPSQQSPHPYPATAYEAFLYTERGIYRPGETVVITGLVRDRQLQAVVEVPAELLVTDSQGKTVHRQTVATDRYGVVRLDLALAEQARTGLYTARLGVPGSPTDVADESWGQCSFMVGFYTPPRLRVELSLDREQVRPGDEIEASLRAAYYYGSPAADCAVSFRAAIEPRTFSPDGYADYTFGNAETEGSRVDLPVAALRTDAAGTSRWRIALPREVVTGAAATVDITGTVSEPGGRTVAAMAAAVLHPTPCYLGLRALWDAARGTGPSLPFGWVALSPDAKPVTPEAPLKYELLRDVWHYALVEDQRGCYVRTWSKERTTVQTGTVEVTPAQTEGRFEVRCEAPGEYAIKLTDASGRVEALLPFWFAQGDGGSGCPSSPAVLRLETDQPVYKPGDQARLTFSAREPGQGLLCTGTDRLQAAVPFAVSAGQNTVLVPVPADTPYGSLYAGVTVVRAEIPASQVPRRRFGLARLSLDQSSRRLNVAVAVAPEPRPGTTARVRVSLTSGTKPAAGAVQLLAVDEGLLALTGRATPDPFAFFFGDRRCAVQFTDVYDRIFPELDLKLAGESHPGGDGYDERLAPALPPQFKPAVVVLPLVQVPAGGETEVDLPLPEHQGELRIMAVATNALAVGSTQASVRLRREVTILLTAPKAVAPGDEFELTAQVTNHQLPETEFGFALTTAGPVSPAVAVPAGLRLAKGADGSLRCRFRAQAETAGRADFAAEVRAGELRFGSTTLTAVRPATPPRFRSGCLQVPASRSREVELPQGWLPGTGRGRLEVSAWQGTEVLGPLAWLRRYPYGCLEQTVSAAFPLLFLPAEPRLAGGEKSPSLSGEVGAAIRRVLLMELPAGGFAMWPGDPHLWPGGSVYTAHFLAEARHSGYEVDEALWDRTVTFLRRAARSNDPPQPLGERGYLLYVLAATGRAESGLAETLLADRDAPRGARLLAAAALARAGRARTGAEALPQLQEGAVPAADAPPAFDLDSPVRRAALELWARLDLEPDSASVPHLLARLQEQRSAAEGHWGSTHDNALAVAALLRWAGQCPQDPATTGQVEGPDGQSHAVSQASPYSVLDPPSGGRFRISSAGPGTLFCTWESSGVPLALAAEAVADGIAVERHYLDESGRPKAEFRHGDAVFVKLVLRSSGPLANVVVADLLPGALESEESLAAVRCCTQEEVRNLAVHHVEKRDDRVLLFCDLSGGGEAAFAYGTRAVSRGRFTVPAVSAEAMYRPRTRAYRFDGRQISVE